MNNTIKSQAYIVSAILLGVTGMAQAAYPSKSIRLVVGFPPGGGNDAIARLFGQKLAEHLGQPVVIDNRPGAGGNLAAEMVARAAADGYTIMVASSSHPIQRLLKKHLPYDPIGDFTGVAQLVHYRSALVTQPGIGISNVRELIAQAKARPASLTFASSGIGTGAHLAAELFRYLTGVNLTHIPYKGTAQAITDLMGGRVNMMFAPILAVSQQVRATRLRALGVTSSKRSRILREVPTLGEAGVTGYDFGAWYGLFGPARMSRAAVSMLHAEVQRALTAGEIQERLKREDLDAAQATPAEFDAIRRAELAKWSTISAKLNLKFD